MSGGAIAVTAGLRRLLGTAQSWADLSNELLHLGYSMSGCWTLAGASTASSMWQRMLGRIRGLQLLLEPSVMSGGISLDRTLVDFGGGARERVVWFFSGWTSDAVRWLLSCRHPALPGGGTTLASRAPRGRAPIAPWQYWS